MADFTIYSTQIKPERKNININYDPNLLDPKLFDNTVPEDKYSAGTKWSEQHEYVREIIEEEILNQHMYFFKSENKLNEFFKKPFRFVNTSLDGTLSMRTKYATANILECKLVDSSGNVPNKLDDVTSIDTIFYCAPCIITDDNEGIPRGIDLIKLKNSPIKMPSDSVELNNGIQILRTSSPLSYNDLREMIKKHYFSASKIDNLNSIKTTINPYWK
jgi:hypothetical protein